MTERSILAPSRMVYSARRNAAAEYDAWTADRAYRRRRAVSLIRAVTRFGTGLPSPILSDAWTCRRETVPLEIVDGVRKSDGTLKPGLAATGVKTRALWYRLFAEDPERFPEVTAYAAGSRYYIENDPRMRVAVDVLRARGVRTMRMKVVSPAFHRSPMDMSDETASRNEAPTDVPEDTVREAGIIGSSLSNERRRSADTVTDTMTT